MDPNENMVFLGFECMLKIKYVRIRTAKTWLVTLSLLYLPLHKPKAVFVNIIFMCAAIAVCIFLAAVAQQIKLWSCWNWASTAKYFSRVIICWSLEWTKWVALSKSATFAFQAGISCGGKMRGSNKVLDFALRTSYPIEISCKKSIIAGSWIWKHNDSPS